MPSDGNNLVGVKELTEKLGKLAGAASAKKLRSISLRSTTKTFGKIKKSAPRGTKPHRTYRGLLVAPGFLSRSILRKSKVFRSRGVVSVVIGVRKEAFYGPQFYDEGDVIINSRRVSKPTAFNRRRKEKVQIKPYNLRGRYWFKSKFIADRSLIESEFVRIMRSEIERIAK